MARGKQSVAGIGAMLVALAAGTLFIFGTRLPEARGAVSADGLVSVSGNAAASLGTLSIETAGGVGRAIDVGAEYQIALGGRPVPSGFSVTIGYVDASLGSVAPNHLSVFAYDRAAQAWIALPSVVDPAARTVTATSSGADALMWTLAAR